MMTEHEISQQIAARIWCDHEYSHIEMNPHVAQSIGYMLLREAQAQGKTLVKRFQYPDDLDELRVENNILREVGMKLEDERNALRAEMEALRAVANGAMAERDALLQTREEAVEIHSRIMSEECPSDEYHCTCVPALRQELAEMKAERDALKANELLWQSSVMEKDRVHNRDVNKLECDNAKLLAALDFIKDVGFTLRIDGRGDMYLHSDDHGDFYPKGDIMTEELKPCPFCGSEDVFTYKDFAYSTFNVQCRACGMGEDFASMERLLINWNARPIEDALRAERDALKAVMRDVITMCDNTVLPAEYPEVIRQTKKFLRRALEALEVK